MSGTGWFGGVGLSIVTLGCATAGGAAQSSWDDSLWEIQAQEFRVETYKGRESLYMRDGTAWMKGVEFQDGVIEMDVAAPAIQGFHGIRFRAVTPFDHEHVYIRPHLSGKSDAVQYNPIYHGISSWQLYSEPRYALPVTIEADRWIHVRIAVQGSRMELSVDGELLVFPELVRDPESGAFGISSSGAAGRFANVVVRPDADPEFQGGEGAQAIVAEAGTVKVWRVSEAFEEAEIDGLTELPPATLHGQTWARLSAEVRGIANIARLRSRQGGNNTVFAAVTLRVDRARTVRVRLGFSDRVRAFLNGTQLYAAGDEYRSRDYRFLGTMGLFDELFLPLVAGDNELWLAVSEDFGGWGVSLQVLEGQDVEVVGQR